MGNLIKNINVPALRESVKQVSITNKDDAIGWIHALSAIKYGEKDIKNKAYNFLDKRCKDCEEHYTSDGSLGVKKVERTTKKYPENDEMKELKEKIKELEDEIEDLPSVKERRKKIEELEDEYEHQKLLQEPEETTSSYYKIIK